MKAKKHMARRKIYRRCLWCALFFTCLSLTGVWLLYTYKQIPGSIKLKMGEEQVLNIGLPVSGEIVRVFENSVEEQAVTVGGQGVSNIPADSIHIDLRKPVTMKADTLSSYQMDLRLFGFIPFKQVEIEVIKDMMLKPVGLPIGIYLKTDGVLVIGIGDFLALDGTNVSPSQYLLKTGDYILEVNKEEVTSKYDFIRTIEDSGGRPVVLTIRRDGEVFDVALSPVQNQNAQYKLGIWVRDNAQGVGTMTFVDEEGNFGALGHGINDVDTSIVMELDSGTLYRTEIIAIKKGVRGEPGEMTGMIDYSGKNILGVVTENTSQGIFGTCNETMLSEIETEAIPIGLKQEVEIGPAQILCTVDGEPDYYDIRIKDLFLDHANVNKGIVIQVTDPELIAVTGGIVQGMSGAPIIQNGKLVGAVTHVLVNDPTVGSGSLLLTVKKHLDKNKQRDLAYYGQEKNTATYNLTRMNLLLHGVRPEKMTIKNGDTLSNDWPEDPENPNEGVQFDAVVMNPPYSAKNWNKAGLKVSDPRFEVAGALPPDSKGDFAFLLHGLYHLGTNGTMAIVLPHGVLFRGSSEGEIRKRLLNKNYIDTIIGLPSNLFTNTGIPVVIVVLKKNRNVADPVLLIDASNSFVKVGKQNVLQEKDIAKIVDIYMSKQEIPGYSHLATRDEVIKNEYNMNIPRYVESVEKEVAQDVDAHLFGGIPSKNVSDLKVLQALVPDILTRNVEEIRPGYIKLMKTVNEISSEVFNDESIIAMSNEIEFKTTEYISKYWELLKNVTADSDLAEIKDGMLSEIKQILSEYQYIDVYGGYQIIAEIWKNALTHDIELIANEGFYNVGRKREPKLVMKGTGTNRREEQDGWIGSIIPNELIADILFAEQLKRLENKRIKIQDIETELSELVEAAKVEDSDEYNALIEAIKKNEEDEPGDAFDNKALKEELKKSKNGSSEYLLLKRVESLINSKTVLTREIRTEEKELADAVQDRIIILTDEEIDILMYKKWFGNTTQQMVGLIQVTLKEEVNFLQKLEDRYSYTLSDIDMQIERLMKNFEMLNNELVVG